MILGRLLAGLHFASSWQRWVFPDVGNTSHDLISAEEPEEAIVSFFNWEDYVAPDTIARFQQETGIRVELVTFATHEELIGRARSRPDRYDVVVLDDAAFALFQELGLLRELDRKLIPNLANIDATFLHRPVDPDYRFSAPYHWGTTLLAYRRDLTGDLPASWEVLWDKRFRGHIWMLDDLQEVMGVVALSCGYRMNTRRPHELARVREQVIKLSDLGVRLADTLEIKDALISGDCWVGVLYSGDAVRAAEANSNVVYKVPERGAPLWVDTLCVLRDAPHVTEAHAFINFMLRGDVAAAYANYVRFASANAAARSAIEKTLLEDSEIWLSTDRLARCEYYEPLDAPALRFQTELRSLLRTGRGDERGAGETTSEMEARTSLPR